MAQFIDLRALARVRNMELAARAVATGFLQGVHASQSRGTGIEFSQYRSYEPGDAPSRIDWKLYARSDRYFVREAERESDTDIWLVLDASQSMSLRSEAGVWDKFDYGRHLAATLAYLALNQGDRLGLLTMNEFGVNVLRPMAGMRQWHRSLHALANSKVAGVFPEVVNLTNELKPLQNNGLVVFISDLYQDQSEIDDVLSTLSTPRNEVTVLQLECQDEIHFPFQGTVQFEDLETGERVVTHAPGAKADYLSARSTWQRARESTLSRMHVGLDRINVDEPLDQALVAYLNRRRRSTLP